jgi:nucleotide sugar dehydrogenase
MNKIGVIGNGFVGSAVAEGFKHYADVKVYDSNPNKSPDNFQDVLQQECIFICVPTPMSEGGGQCDMSYIYDVFDKVKHLITESIFIIKSTVPVGTTSQLKSKYPKLHIIHSPEFLTARTAKIDFITPSRVIVGYPKEFYSKMHLIPNKVLDLFRDRLPGTNCLLMTSEESELAKYSANCFFATKISFFNEIKMLSDAFNCDFNTLLDGILSDGRIALSHYQVPGHDGEPGFGGTCFPKDINSLIHIMKEKGLQPNVLEGAWKTNMKLRSEFNKEKFDPINGTDTSGCGHDHT